MFYCISKTALLTPAYFTCSCSFHLQMLSGSLRILGAFFTCSGSFHLQMLRVALSDQWEPTSPLLAVFTCKFSKWLSQTNGSLLLLFRQFSPSNTQSGFLTPVGAYFTCSGSSQTRRNLLHLFRQFSLSNAQCFSQTSESLLHLFWHIQLQMLSGSLSDRWEPTLPFLKLFT